MKNEIFYSMVVARPDWEDPQASHLQQAITTEAFLSAAKKILAEAVSMQAAVANTLPTPDKVLDIAHQQGMVKGIYRVFDTLVSLTPEEKHGTESTS